MHLLKPFQAKAVEQLLDHTYETLALPPPSSGNQGAVPHTIQLESPTGSGKTVMLAHYLYRLVQEAHTQPDIDDNITFIWFAPNTLHIQSFEALQKQYEDTRKLNCLKLENLSGSPVLQPHDLLFVNWSSVDSLNRIWRKENETNTNLETLVENTQNNDTKIILIIDEAHLSAFKGKQAIKVRELIGAHIELSVTATPDPKYRPDYNVRIRRDVVIKQEMIKKGVELNRGLDPAEQNGANVDMYVLSAALQKRRELKAMYAAELGEGVLNPLLLVQLPSDSNSMTDEDKKIRDTIVGLLDAISNEEGGGISTNNGRLALWFSGERDTDGLEAMNGLQDVLLFKQAIAQGWDCPRACILVSFRTVKSESFGIQTVGRILRMAHQRHYTNDALNYGYVYTNIETNKISFVPTDADYFNIQMAKRLPSITDKFETNIIVNDRETAGVLTAAFDDAFDKVMYDRYEITELPDNTDLFTPTDWDKYRAQAADNIAKMCAKGWTFEIDEAQIALPTDIKVSSYEVGIVTIQNEEMQHFKITELQFIALFDRFCMDSLVRFNRSKSWFKLKMALTMLAQDFFNTNENAIRKVYLHPQNKALLIEDITLALERTASRPNPNRRSDVVAWEVPETRFYSDLYVEQPSTTHALTPFLALQKASQPEKLFAAYLETQTAHIDWWYKNGDSGREHFAVSYMDSHNKLRLFYVDFVIKFKSGRIGLFDTKTPKSDPDAPHKHNALLAYMETQMKTKPDRPFLGGIIIGEEVSGIIKWRYCENRITDTSDLRGWSYFKPAEL